VGGATAGVLARAAAAGGADEAALAIDEKQRGKARDGVVRVEDGLRPAFASGGVEGGEEFEPVAVAPHPAVIVGAGVGGADGKEDEPVGGVFFREFAVVRHRGDARAAPGGPDVEQHEPAAEVRQLQLAAVGGEHGEVGGHLAGLRAAAAGGGAGRDDLRFLGGQGEDERRGGGEGAEGGFHGGGPAGTGVNRDARRQAAHPRTGGGGGVQNGSTKVNS
jgi:hypothetical protein